MKRSFIAVASGLVASVVLLRAAAAQETAPNTTPPAMVPHATPSEAAPPAPPAPPAASAAPAAPAASGAFPKLGGHLGFAVPIVSISAPTTVIGSDFVVIGLTPGLTVKLSDHWAVDFEFIARNELKNTPAATTYVIDPGVIYSGDSAAGGLRIATEVGARTNIGLVPIVVLPIVNVTDTIRYYIEGDVPMFLFDGGTKIKASIGFQFQSGFAF